MPFPQTERKTLLGVKGVGPTVIVRMEQMGFCSLAQLAQANAHDLVSEAAVLLGSSCWKNSPQSRAAIQTAISMAQAYCSKNDNQLWLIMQNQQFWKPFQYCLINIF